ncbi:MAG TPA: hypothetical protein VM427_07510, partial [Patescibacteria group bacterium]|nr:hypothetical protein [Patescibacteria group bacterium]
DGLSRIPAPAGFAATDVALNGDGTRLAVVWRSDAAVRVEILAFVDGRWAPGPTSTAPADATVSIAWLR